MPIPKHVYCGDYPTDDEAIQSALNMAERQEGPVTVHARSESNAGLHLRRHAPIARTRIVTLSNGVTTVIPQQKVQVHLEGNTIVSNPECSIELPPPDETPYYRTSIVDGNWAIAGFGFLLGAGVAAALIVAFTTR